MKVQVLTAHFIPFLCELEDADLMSYRVHGNFGAEAPKKTSANRNTIAHHCGRSAVVMHTRGAGSDSKWLTFFTADSFA